MSVVTALREEDAWLVGVGEEYSLLGRRIFDKVKLWWAGASVQLFLNDNFG